MNFKKQLIAFSLFSTLSATAQSIYTQGLNYNPVLDGPRATNFTVGKVENLNPAAVKMPAPYRADYVGYKFTVEMIQYGRYQRGIIGHSYFWPFYEFPSQFHIFSNAAMQIRGLDQFNKLFAFEIPSYVLKQNTGCAEIFQKGMLNPDSVWININGKGVMPNPTGFGSVMFSEITACSINIQK